MHLGPPPAGEPPCRRLTEAALSNGGEAEPEDHGRYLLVCAACLLLQVLDEVPHPPGVLVGPAAARGAPEGLGEHRIDQLRM